MIKIIIIEDLPIVLEGIRLLLHQINDFKVVAEYKNGQEYINNIENIEADIILTDIDMPIMNGIETTKKATTKYPQIKIIALSMYSDSKYYSEMISSGAKGFVLKQSSMNELENAIREVYNGGSFFSKELLQNVILNMQNLENAKNQELIELSKLSEREIEFVTFICQGFSNKELAEKLFVSIKTIESNKAKIMEKIGAKNNAGIIIWAVKNKIVTL